MPRPERFSPFRKAGYAAGMPRLGAFPLLASVLMGCALASSPAQQTPIPALRNGQAFTARGRLEMRSRGWHRFLILQLDQPYLPDFGLGPSSKPVSAVELNAPGRSAILSEHVGEVVEASGTLQLDNVSPFFWNGVALLAETVRLSGEAALQSQRIQPRVPAGTEFYTVTIAMVPHQLEWRREAYDIETGQLLPDSAVDGCSLSGAGDAMHCLCIPGFAPVRAGVVPHPLPPMHWGEIPSSPFALPGMAQFTLPDPGATHPQTVEVACKRKGFNAK